MLIGRKRHKRPVSGSRRFSEVWDEFARKVELKALKIDPDEVFANVRVRVDFDATPADSDDR